MVDVKIEVITYEQSRLAYFKELQSRQKKRFEQFEKSSAIKELPPQEKHYQLSKMGEVLQYYDDIVKMLEDYTLTPKERGGEK
jgi:D-mannonate dehydratase